MKKMSISMKIDLIACITNLIFSFIYTFQGRYIMFVYTLYAMIWLAMFKIDEYKK